MPLTARAASFGRVDAGLPLASPGQAIGLLGGTFNPPHAGHLQISEIAQRRLKLDRVWWVVTPGNPLKSKAHLPSLEHRMEACRALTDNPRIVVTGFEVSLRTTYTAATLGFLQRRYPGVRFVWIMGADNLAGFHRWQRWRDISGGVPMAIVDRPGWRLKALASPAARTLARAKRPEASASTLAAHRAPCWTFLSGPLSPHSSTALRARLSR
jgi:nicotinate-nucleotide adenylyltransferase